MGVASGPLTGETQHDLGLPETFPECEAVGEKIKRREYDKRERCNGRQGADDSSKESDSKDYPCNNRYGKREARHRSLGDESQIDPNAGEDTVQDKKFSIERTPA